MFKGLIYTFAAIVVLAVGCDTTSEVQPPEDPTLEGNWKYVSFAYTHCTDSADNRTDQCLGTALECGILSLTANTWFWTPPDSSGSPAENGTYTLSGNYIILSGSASPASHTYSLSGSTFTFTRSTLTFFNSSNTTGCTHTVTFSRYTQPFSPLG